jgi:FlgD Ig-like domain
MSSRRTGYAIVATLILVSAVAFTRAEQLKLERSPITAPRITKHFSTACRPSPLCPARATLSFRLRRASRVSLTLVDASGAAVRALTPPQGRGYGVGRVTVHWNGRGQDGGIAPDGRYLLRVDLLTLGRTITIPSPLIVDTQPPRLTLVSPPGTAPVRYHANEPVHVFMAVRPLAGGPTRVLRGRKGRVRIPASLRHAPAVMTMVAVDLAGNRSPAIRAGTLR